MRSGIELGVYGHDRIKLELEGLDRAQRSRRWSLAREARTTATASHTDGAEMFHRAVRSSSGTDHSWRSTVDSATVELDRISGRLQSLVAIRTGMTARSTKPR